MRLVFCDDNRILCKALAAALEARGHQVMGITSGTADHLAALDSHKPHTMVPNRHSRAGRTPSSGWMPGEADHDRW